MPAIEQKQAQQAEREGDSMTTAESAQRGQGATTQQIIRELRRAGTLGPIINALMLAAAQRLEQQERELVETLREPCPEPSRLEIAARAMQAFIGSSVFVIAIPKNSLKYADALIAAAKPECQPKEEEAK